MATKKPTEDETQQPIKRSVFSFFIAIMLLSSIATAAGWYLGTNLLVTAIKNDETGNPASKPETAKNAVGNEDRKRNAVEIAEPQIKPHDIVIKLDPIVVALKGNSRVWLRLELSIVADADARLEEVAAKTRMSSDIAAFLRTVSLQQISGPSGYLHLREDLLDRTRLVTQGKASDVLITTMVFE